MSSGGTVVKWHTCTLNALQKKQGKVVKATGIGNKRRFKVKWSDGKRTEETARGLVIPGSAEWEGNKRDTMASLLSVRTTLTMMRKVRKRKEGTIDSG